MWFFRLVERHRNLPAFAKDRIGKRVSVYVFIYAESTPQPFCEHDERLPDCRIIMSTLHKR